MTSADNRTEFGWLEFMQENLPDGYEYKFISHSYPVVVFRTKFRSKQTVVEWLSKLQSIEWRVRKTYPVANTYIYKTDRRCQHNTYYKPKTNHPYRRIKNANCPSHIRITVKASIKRTDVKETVKEKFLLLFRDGYSPADALAAYKEQFKGMEETEYKNLCADRAYVPDYKWVWHLRHSLGDKIYETSNQPQTITTEASLKADNSAEMILSKFREWTKRVEDDIRAHPEAYKKPIRLLATKWARWNTAERTLFFNHQPRTGHARAKPMTITTEQQKRNDHDNQALNGNTSIVVLEENAGNTEESSNVQSAILCNT